MNPILKVWNKVAREFFFILKNLITRQTARPSIKIERAGLMIRIAIDTGSRKSVSLIRAATSETLKIEEALPVES
jgi:hypothetical protein